jgi:CHAT domain-containing protein/tetratricopeptide (TPR) repeat protein
MSASRPGRNLIAAALVVAGLFVPAAPAVRTQSADEAACQGLLNDAKRAFTQGDFNRVTASLNKALAMATSISSDLCRARAEVALADIDVYALRQAEATRRLADAEPVLERAHDAEGLGRIALIRGQLDQLAKGNEDPGATPFFERAAAWFVEAGDKHGKVEADFGALEAITTPGEELDHRAARVIDEARAVGDRGLEGRTLHLWGDRLFAAGDLNAAAGKLDDAVAVLQGTIYTDSLGTVYNSLGRLYRAHGQLTAALEYQQKALALHQHSANSYVHIQSLNAVAATYLFMGDATQAKAYYAKALALAESSRSSTFVDFLRASYGSTLAASGELERGRAMLVQSLPAATGPTRAYRYLALADMDLRLGRNQDALAEGDNAIADCGAAEHSVCMSARLVHARAELALGHIDAALDDEHQVMALVEEQHGRLATSDFMKQGFLSLWAPTYSLAIEIETRRGHPREALEAAELGRSRALLDLLASRPVVAGGSEPVAPVARAGEPKAARRSDAMARPASTDDLIAIARRLQSTLVVYWVDDHATYMWTVAPNGAIGSARTAVARSHLDALVRATAALNSPDAAAPAAATPSHSSAPAPIPASMRSPQAVTVVATVQPAWRELYDLLIAPIARYLPTGTGARITIVPHGSLLALPFAALRDAQGRYLVERYAIHSAPTGGLFSFTAGALDAAARSGPALLVADPTPAPRISGEPVLARLPGAAAEAQTIARLLPSGRATILAARDATEPRVVVAMRDASFVHFATHAVVRDANPAASFLALARSDSSPASGELTPDKIYALALRANLVVLGACRSGGGQPSGDGIAALARAFFYAGTPSVMVSVWNVADEPANRLLPAFYRAWIGGADKASALRTAQLHLIADLRAGRVIVHSPLGDLVLPEDPGFWAGFVLLGEAD